MTVPARKSISRVNAALRWRVGRSGERGTLAFAHAFGFRCNKGGEEPPTASHTHVTHTGLGRSAGRGQSSPSFSPSPSLSLFLETDDRAARSPRLTGRSASCGITRDNYSGHSVTRGGEKKEVQNRTYRGFITAMVTHSNSRSASSRGARRASAACARSVTRQ